MPKGDGGHWPRGRRRNAGVQVEGHRSVPALLRAVRRVCDEHRGALTDLSRRMRVHRKTVYVWLSEEKWPSQRRANQMARWLRQYR